MTRVQLLSAQYAQTSIDEAGKRLDTAVKAYSSPRHRHSTSTSTNASKSSTPRRSRRRKAPHDDVPVVAPAHDPVLAQTDARHRAAVAHERRRAPAVLERPELDRAVVAAGDKPLRVRVRRGRPHALDVPKERARGLARAHVPHAHGVVQAPGHEHGRPPRPRRDEPGRLHLPDVPREELPDVPREELDARAAREVSQMDRAVVRCGEKHLAPGRGCGCTRGAVPELHGVDPVAVAVEREALAGLEAPHLDGRVDAPPRRDGRVEVETHDTIRVTLERAHAAARAPVPHAQRAVHRAGDELAGDAAPVVLDHQALAAHVLPGSR
jgi:hypothetical protein